MRKVIFLILDILVFMYQIGKKVILPTRRRKGNVLSSLLSFFVGLVERVLSFEKSMLRQPVVFRHKYVRQILILVVGFLFLLSSIEWAVGQAPVAALSETGTVVINESADNAVTVLAQRPVIASAQMPGREFSTPGYLSYKVPYAVSDGTVAVKRWLRFRVFRV
jgi:hypothetical protein